MADTPKEGETVTPGDSQTTVTTTSAPVVDNAGAAEVERLRLEKEKADLRIRQLENKLTAREKDDEDAKQKQLEEQGKFEDLYKKAEEERNNLIRERDDAAKQTNLNKTREELLSKFPTNVQEIAETTGLSLTDDSEEAVADLTKKLESIASKVPKDTRIQGSNPAPVTDTAPEREQLVQKMRFDNGEVRRNAVREAIRTIPGVDGMRKIAGVEVQNQ